MSIDWNNAPADAEAGMPERITFHAAWYRRVGAGHVQQICEGLGLKQWTWMGGRKDFPVGHEMRPAQKEAQTWNGEGLPPVGVPLEYQRRGAPNGKWYPTQINFLSAQHVIFCDSDGDEVRENPSDILFRPIRTPEQIAAAALRSKACDEMFGVILSLPEDRRHNGSDICEALYDANYRKQVAP